MPSRKEQLVDDELRKVVHLLQDELRLDASYPRVDVLSVPPPKQVRELVFGCLLQSIVVGPIPRHQLGAHSVPGHFLRVFGSP